MSKFFLCTLLGYVLGTLNPAALIASIKKVDLRKLGTRNLGATNVALNIGKRYGLFVMLFDMAKAYTAVKLAQVLFPALAVAGLAAGTGSVIGHIFPAQMKFKGGKGSATFGGMILALDPMLFLTLLIFGILVTITTGYTFLLPVSAAAVSPLTAGLYFKSLAAGVLLLPAAALILYKHRENFRRIREGTEASLRTLRNRKK